MGAVVSGEVCEGGVGEGEHGFLEDGWTGGGLCVGAGERVRGVGWEEGEAGEEGAGELRVVGGGFGAELLFVAGEDEGGEGHGAGV